MGCKILLKYNKYHMEHSYLQEYFIPKITICPTHFHSVLILHFLRASVVNKLNQKMEKSLDAFKKMGDTCINSSRTNR